MCTILPLKTYYLFILYQNEAVGQNPVHLVIQKNIVGKGENVCHQNLLSMTRTTFADLEAPGLVTVHI